jgi:putative ABC transport system permease protein
MGGSDEMRQEAYLERAAARGEGMRADFGSWLRDVVLSCRGFRRRPVFVFVAVASLALGIGGNALVFSVVDSVLLQPLSYPNADALVAVWLTPPNEPEQRFGTNTGVYFTIRDNNDSFESFGTGRLNEALTVTLPGEVAAHSIQTQFFSEDMLSTVGVQPLLGDWPPQDPNGIAISHGFWQRQFGGSPNVLGAIVDVGVVTVPIAAVMPEGFQLLKPDTEIWIHQADADLQRAARSPNRLFTLVGRLKPGVTIDQAQAEMNGLAQVIGMEFPETHMGWGLKVESLRDASVGGWRQLLWIFQGAVLLVLLIACSNVAALVMSRAASQQKELAVRSALGSGRWRLVRQLVTDNLLLSVLGAAFGIVLAWAGVRGLAASEIEGFPRLAEVSMEWPVVAWAGLLAFGSGIVFGVLPALHVSSVNLTAVLREEGRGSSSGKPKQRLRSAFVVGQVALALIILVASGLVLRSLALINAAGVGFDAANLTVLELPFPRTYNRNTGENTPAGGLLVEVDSRFAEDSEAVVERLSRVPGVRSVAAAATVPLGGSPQRVAVRLDDETLSPSEQTARRAEWYPVSSTYFATLGIPVLRGRALDSGDRALSRPVAVINAAMAERFWPGQDPLGRLLQTDVVDAPALEVVGIVGNVRQDRYQRVAQPQLYVSRLQLPRRMDNAVAVDLLSTAVVVRMDRSQSGAEAALRSAVQEANPAVPVSRIRAIEDYASGQIQDLQRATVLLSTFATIAVALALIGIFGVVAHLVSQRTVEIGIRMALGAQKQDVLLPVLRQGFMMMAVGLVIGTAGALVLTRLVGSLLYGVTAMDPLSFVAALLVLTIVGLLACYFPARRVLRIDPVVALRSEG